MSLSAFVGSKAIGTTTGNVAVTGVGFQPKIVFFFGDNKTADAVTSSNAGATAAITTSIFGVGISSSSRAVIYTNDDFSGGCPRVKGTLCASVDSFSSGAGHIVYTIDLVSLDSDGFTFNVVATEGTNAILNYLCLGGADLTNVGMISGTMPTATGNAAFTGMGFKPDAIIMIGGQDNVSDTVNLSEAGQGFAVSTTKRGANASGVAVSTVERYQRVNKAYVQLDQNTTNTVSKEADLVSMDSDGCTLNFTTANATTGKLYIIGLKGGQFSVGNITQKASTGSQVTTGNGFQPQALLLTSVLNTAVTTIDQTRICTMTGFGVSSSQRGTLMYGDANNAVASLDRANIYKSYADDAGPTLQGAADLTSLDTDGFTLNYGTSDGTAREIIYMAFGNAPTAPAFLKVTRPFPFVPGSPHAR